MKGKESQWSVEINNETQKEERVISSRGSGGGRRHGWKQIATSYVTDDMLSDKCGRHWWEANQIKSIWVVPKLQPNHSEGIFFSFSQ